MSDSIHSSHTLTSLKNNISLLKKRYLRLEWQGGILGWIWMLLSLGSIVSIGLAIFTELGWWWPVALFFLALFFKGLTRYYRDEWLKTGRELAVLEKDNDK